ncbi:protein argonaute 4B-like [Phoenix dactylifera]|uniref:Protein argonaute 4B-like n=1 Tax=Phoenix dactylifera TaxID=42345 RepID=A0A8B7BJS4_PHODC|nr:protein argonaute 4B-like [Phoenix dactylifera]
MESHDGVDPQSETNAVLPPPPPTIHPNVVPVEADHEQCSPPKKASKPKRVPMARPGLASRGQPITLLTNHFRVSVQNLDGYFYHYSVSLKYEDNHPVDGNGVGRRVMDKLQQTYDTELGNKDFAYDGEKNLFTMGALPQVNNEFTVVLEDISSSRTAGDGSLGGNDGPSESVRKRLRRPYQTKTFKVELSFAARIPMQSIAMALKGQEKENSQEALRVLDIILRQHSAKQGCLLVCQSFFQNNPSNLTEIGGGVLGCRGFHSSFKTIQGGLSLNVDVSTTLILKPGPVVDFLVANQNVRDPCHIDWAKAKRMLKNLRIKASPSNTEFKIVGLSDLPCSQQKFALKQKSSGNGDDIHTTEITVYEYFVKYRNIEPRYSADLPCINVGKPKRPTYFPMELCTLVSLQRYTKALTNLQRASLVEKSRQKPKERMDVLARALNYNNYNADPMLRACGISINTHFTQVNGRVLPAPKLKVGNGEYFTPMKGRWNFNNKKLIEPTTLNEWAVVNFSARCDIRNLIRGLTKCGSIKGINIDRPSDVFEENPSMRRAPPATRVEDMFERMKRKFRDAPQFLLCLLPERKNSDVYGPWKRRCLSEYGIVTQCIAPTRVNDQYLTNVLLKINAKLGGVNSLLQVEDSQIIPLVSTIPTIIFGMDVSHGSPGRSDVPSVAAVVSSRQWPCISRYRASVRTQLPKVEMIDNLFKPTQSGADDGIIRELLIEFYISSAQRKPDHIIIFRDGVSEPQFNQVLNIELDQIIKACKFLDEQWSPKFTVIIAQKNHHTRFFRANNTQENVPPGTVVDNKVCHPRNYDFYMCSHAGMIGTTRPTHYHVLHDEIGFSADDLQELVHSLSYVYQRSASAISGVAPISYAHLAAAQMGQFIKFDDMSNSSSNHGACTSAGSSSVPELPRLHKKVCSSMFFC